MARSSGSLSSWKQLGGQERAQETHQMCLPCACQLSLDICWEHKALAQVNSRSDPVQWLLLCLKESIIFPDIQFVLLPLPRFVSITQSCQHVCGSVLFFFQMWRIFLPVVWGHRLLFLFNDLLSSFHVPFLLPVVSCRNWMIPMLSIPLALRADTQKERAGDSAQDGCPKLCGVSWTEFLAMRPAGGNAQNREATWSVAIGNATEVGDTAGLHDTGVCPNAAAAWKASRRTASGAFMSSSQGSVVRVMCWFLLLRCLQISVKGQGVKTARKGEMWMWSPPSDRQQRTQVSC